MTPTVSIDIQSDPSGYRADAVLPNGTTVTVLRANREEAIRDCSNQCHVLAGEPIVTRLPFCEAGWAMPFWRHPQWRQYDPGTVDGDVVTVPVAVREGQDGPVPLPVDDQTEGL